MENNQPITAPTRKWCFSTPYDRFVVQQTFILRINNCDENLQLLVAAKRLHQAYDRV